MKLNHDDHSSSASTKNTRLFVLVSDALLVRGHRIGDIFSASKVEEHHLTAFAKVDDARLTYPGVL